MTKIQQAQADLVNAIAGIATAMPQARIMQPYQFARFLQTHLLPTEETFEAIAVDEALWDTQFAGTGDDKLAPLIAVVEAEINAGKTWRVFDGHGAFVEHR